MRNILASLVVVGAACGGGSGADGSVRQAQPVAAEAAMAPAARGTLHAVRMEVMDDGSFVYRPARLTIRQGDRVRWINVSGGPHNVAFYGDRVPAGAGAVLAAAMPVTPPSMGRLSGGLLVQPNATWEMRFADAPPGDYAYFCTPHEMIGMTATLTITN